jgi:hypothetical protein
MKQFKFFYLDRQGNEIEIKLKWCLDKQDAIKLSKNELATINHNDIVKIKTKLHGKNI